MIKLQLFAVALVSASCLHAQESSAETQAIRCAALSYIVTSVEQDAGSFANEMADAATFYGDIHGAGRSLRTAVNMTNGEVLARRELALQEFRASWVSRPGAVIREAALCHTWSARFVPKVVAHPNIDSAAELMRIVGEPPANPAPEQLDLWRTVLPRAFAAWAASGYATPASIRRKIVESMKQP
jgi:hypothetical protein